MEKTTISISREIRNKIQEFGNKGETYDDILIKLYNSAVQRQLQDFLFAEEGFVPIKQAIAEARKKWPKSK